MSSGISLTHYSNGSIATPNLGLNISSVTAGVMWNLGQPVHIQNKPFPVFENSRRFSFYCAGTSKQIYPADGKNYFAAAISANHAWQITRKSAFGTGVDVFYDEATKQKLEAVDESLKSDFDAFRGGIHGSYELVVSDISFILNMGAYLYSKVNDGTFYHRFGVKYKLNEHLFACVHIKSHWGKADFTELGIGYSLIKSKKKKS